MNRQPLQIRVAAFGDSGERLLVTAGMLSWHQSDPSRKLSSVVEDSSIRNRRHHCDCDDRAYSLEGSDLLAEWIAAVDLVNPFLHRCDALFQSAQFFV